MSVAEERKSISSCYYAHHHRYGEFILGFYTPNIWPFGREDGERAQLGLMAGAGLLFRYAVVDHRSYTTTDSVAPPRMMQFMEYAIWGQVRLDAMALQVQFGGGAPRGKWDREPDYTSTYGSVGVRLLLDQL